MTVADLIFKLFDAEFYMFEVDLVSYSKPSDIPKKILDSQLLYWQVIDTDNIGVYTENVDIPDLYGQMVNLGFTQEQITKLIQSGFNSPGILRQCNDEMLEQMEGKSNED